jgi:L-rhamnose isomerase/sugar isomerase
VFEPAFYHTDVPDWGTAYAHCLQLGPKRWWSSTPATTPGTNIEFIVAFLLRERKLGAFDFNSRFYADDDLMAGSADPFQLFRIMYEVVRGGGFAPEAGVCFMLDQCHNIERKIPGQIRSVMNVQELTAKALLVDRDAISAAQQAGDVLGANGVLMDAFATDVLPLLAELRQDMGLDPDPMGAYARSGYDDQIVAERVGGTQAGWGA